MASCLCWYVEPHFFSHLLLDRQKDEYLCSFLEAVLSLVICHLLQPVVRLLLRLAAAVVVAPLPLLLLPPPPQNRQNRYPQHLIQSQCQQPEFHRWLPPRVWFFFSAIAQRVQQSTFLRLLSTTGYSCRNLILRIYELLLQWEQNRSDAAIWLLYTIPAIWGCPRLFSRLTALCSMLLPNNPYRVPQHYKRHVCGPFCSCKHWFFVEISNFWILVFFQTMWVQCATEHLSGQQIVFISYASVDISTHSELQCER